jgi:hypothetical protein
MAIEYDKQEDGIACHGFNDYGDGFYIGFIKPNSEGYYVIKIGRKVTLSCLQLKLISKKLSKINMEIKQ